MHYFVSEPLERKELDRILNAKAAQGYILHTVVHGPPNQTQTTTVRVIMYKSTESMSTTPLAPALEI